MNERRNVANIAGLVRSREAEIDRLTGDLARMETVRQRFQSNLRTMQQLFDEAGQQGSNTLALLALNRAGYRQSLHDTMTQHRAALQAHQENMQVSRQLLTAKSVRCEVWRRELRRRMGEVESAEGRAEQRAQDELATQAWRRSIA
ncbi:hypothetical protein WT59_22010 [Burkholderia territorii]|uniref:flagellar FliJ family protein n=1 Tax=Burkholderia territorii TaxID=1503055 RepID=UPI0007530C99|nr:flagellar FliJ family protein [Burkholderia territorii]KWH08483.1 hypothetical protein WT59_22010 [Burkholderia territorii]